jgi:hypothetical protein
MQSFAPFLTADASAGIQALSPSERAHVIGSLQTAAADRLTFSAPAMSTAAAINQVRGLVKTVDDFDNRMETASRSLKSKADQFAAGIQALSALASPDPNTDTPDPSQEKAAVYAGTVLNLVQSQPLSSLTAGGGPLAQVMTVLGGDSALSGVLSATRGIVVQAQSFAQAGAAALSDVSSLVNFGSSVGLGQDVLGSVTDAVGGLGSLGDVFSSVTPLGAVSGVLNMFGFGGPSEIEQLQAHLDKRLDEIDGRLGVMDRKLDQMLNLQGQILGDLDRLNTKIDQLQDSLWQTRSDILTELYKVDYDVLYNRSITLDITTQQLNSCNSFLRTIEDADHQSYSQKAHYFESPGTPELFKSCLVHLQELVDYGHITDAAAVPNIFQLEAYQGSAGFEGVKEYLDNIRPLLHQYAHQLSSCEANTLAYPSPDLLSSNPILCDNLDLEHIPQGRPRPDPTDLRVAFANDATIKSRLETMLNYKAVLGFAEVVARVVPYTALTDRARDNNHLIAPVAVDQALAVVDLSTARRLTSEALSYLNLAIAQQSILGGNGLTWDEAPQQDLSHPPFSNSVRTFFFVGPFVCVEFRSNPDRGLGPAPRWWARGERGQAQTVLAGSFDSCGIGAAVYRRSFVPVAEAAGQG